MFNELLPDDGIIVINTDIDDYSYFYEGLRCDVITVGSNPEISKYSAANIEYNSTGCCSYDLLINKTTVDHIELCVQGLHNVYNSLAAIAVGIKLGIDMKKLNKDSNILQEQTDVFKSKALLMVFTVVDDYAPPGRNYCHLKLCFTLSTQ